MKGLFNRAFEAALLSAVVIARPQPGSYSHKIVKQTKHYLQKVYGMGLTEMFDSTGRPTRERLSWTN